MKRILSFPAINFLFGILFGGLIAFSVTAQKPETKPVDDTELLMEQSLATMAKVRAATQKADKVVVAKVTEMKEEVQELKTQNEKLKEDVKVLEVAVAASAAPAVPFDILAILPDSTN
jgi:hypothetical protein